MSIPRIPDKIHNTSLKNTILDLLESVALEETALSSIFNSEADKIKAFVGKDMDFPTKPSTKEIILFNETVNKMLDSLLMTEWLLLRKMDSIIQIDVHKMNHGEPGGFDEKDSLWEEEVQVEEESFNLDEEDFHWGDSFFSEDSTKGDGEQKKPKKRSYDWRRGRFLLVINYLTVKIVSPS